MAGDIILGNIKINDETGKTIASMKESIADFGRQAAQSFNTGAKQAGDLIDAAKLLTAQFNGLEVPLIQLPGKVDDITKQVKDLQVAADELELGFKKGTVEASLADLSRFRGEVDTIVRALSAATGVEQNIKKIAEEEKARAEAQIKAAAALAKKTSDEREKANQEAQKAAEEAKEQADELERIRKENELRQTRRNIKARRLRRQRRKRDQEDSKREIDLKKSQLAVQRRLLGSQLKRVERIKNAEKRVNNQRLAELKSLHRVQVRMTKAMLRERDKLQKKEKAALKRLHKAQVKMTKAFLKKRAKERKDADKKLLKEQKESLKKAQRLAENFIKAQSGLLRFGNKMLFTSRIVIAPFINAMTKAARAIIEVGNFAVKSSIKFEAFELQLRALNKSAINTAQEFEKIKEFAAESPLSTDEVVESFIKLKAVGVKQAFETTKTLGQIGLVFNRDLRDVTSSFISLEARTLRRLGIVINRSTSKAILESGNLIRVVDNNVNAIRDAILDIFEKKAPQAFKIFTSSVQAQLKVLLSFMEIFGADLGDKLFRKPLARALVAINAFIRNNSETLVGAIEQIFKDTNRFESNLKKISRRIDELFASEELKKKLATSLSDALSASLGVLISIGETLTITIGRSIFNGFDFARQELDRRGGPWNFIRGKGTEPFDIESIDATTKRQLEENFKKLRKIRADAAKTSGFSVELDDLFGEGLVGVTTNPIKSFINSARQSEEAKKESEEALKRLKGDQFIPFLETQSTIAEFNRLTEGLNRAAVLATLEQRVTVERAVKESKQTLFSGFVDLINNSKDASDKIKKVLQEAFGVIPEGTSEAAKKMFTTDAFEKAKIAIKKIEELKVQAKEKGIKLSEIIIQDEAKVINEAVNSVKKQIKLNKEKLKIEEKVLEIQKKIFDLRDEKVFYSRTRDRVSPEMFKTINTVLDKQIDKLKQQIPKEFKGIGAAARKALEKEILQLQGLLKKLTAGELSEATKEDTPQDRAKKILKEIGDAFFIGRSLGSQILDEAFLTDNKFKNKIEQFFISAAEQFDVGKTATTQKGLRELFDLMLREDKEAAEEVFKRLSASAFEDVASSGVLSRLQKSSGFLTKILRDRLKEIGDAAGSAKGRLLEMLSTTAGQNKLARDLLNSTELLKQTNEELAKAGGFFDSLGKKTSLAFRQGGLEEQYVKFAKRLSTVRKEIVQTRAGFTAGLPEEIGTGLFEDVVDEKKFRDLLTNVQENIVPFVNAVEGQAGKIIQIDRLLEGTDFVPSVKKKLRAQLEKTDTETLFTDATAQIEAFKEGPLRSLEAQVGEGTALGFERFFTKLKTDAVNMAQATQAALNGIASSIQNNLVNALVALAEGTATVEDAFKQMAAAIVKDLIRLAIQYLVTAAAAAVLNALTGGAAGGVGAATNAVSSGISGFSGGAAGIGAGMSGFNAVFNAKGGIMKGNMGPVHKYAEGGIARSPQVAIFGEGGGAEAFVPLPDGRTIPVTMRGGGGGGSQNVNVNFNVSAIDQAGVASFLMAHQRDITMTVIDAVNSNRSFRSAI